MGGFTVDVAGRPVGVRTNDDEATALLRAALGPSVVDVPAPTGGIRVLFGRANGTVPPLHFVYRDRWLVLQTASFGRALRTALALPDAWLDPPEGTVGVDAHLLLRARRAVVVTGPFADVVFAAAPRLSKRGWNLVVTSRLWLDRDAPDGPAVVVAPRRLRPVPAVLAHLEQLHPRTPDEARVPPDRCPVVAVACLGPTAAGASLPPPLDALDRPVHRVDGWDAADLLRVVDDPLRPAQPAEK